MKSTRSIADNLHDAQQKLSSVIQHLLPDYAKKMVWDEGKILDVQMNANDESGTLPDPAIVQLSKHCLFALQEAEIVAKGAGTVLGRYQEKGIRGVVAGEIKDALPEFSAYYSLDEKDRTKQKMEPLAKNTQGAEAYFAAQRLSQHLQAITKILAQANLPKETTDKLTAMTESLRNLSPKTVLSGQFPNLSETLSNVISTYFNSNRPAAPVRPEQQYESKKGTPCIFLNRTPNYQKDKRLKPNSYVVIKESHKPWQFVYLNEKREPQVIKESDIPEVNSILEKASNINQLTQEGREEVANHLAMRWNPSMQDRAEWFVLVDPLRQAMSHAQRMHQLMMSFINDAKKRKGSELDAAQVALIERTAQALENSRVAESGYYIFLEGQETELSRNLKAIFNVIWSINQLSKGYWENPGPEAHLQMLEHSKNALDNYKKINWPAFQTHGDAVSDQLINAMLFYANDMAFSPLQQISQLTHDIELQHHLRFGALLEKIRPLFDGFESIYQERNLGVLNNPLGYSEATDKELKEKLEVAREKEDDARQDFNLLDAIITNLQWYEMYGKDITQPSPSGSRIGSKLALVMTQEKVAQNLLLDLTELKKTHTLNQNQLTAIDEIEHRLLADLSYDGKKAVKKAMPEEPENQHDQKLLQKVRNSLKENKEHQREERRKGYVRWGLDMVGSVVRPAPQTPWPQAEVSLVVDAASQLRTVSHEKILDVTKYEEALEQHNKMKIEFALRSLKNAGLIPLIEASKQGIEQQKRKSISATAKINIKQKRKLAIILADIHGEKRSDYLANVSARVQDFVTNPEEIKKIIEQAYTVDLELGHALAVEAVLANYVSNVPPAILHHADPAILQRDLTNALDRLEVQHIMAMLPKNATDSISYSLAIFIILLRKQSISAENIAAIKESNHIVNQNDLIKMLIAEYNQHKDKIVMNKIGLLLGRLAHADTNMANLIFNNKDARAIVQRETLAGKENDGVRSDRALYFEALVNTFSFNYTKENHALENRNFAVFLQENKANVIKIYKAIHPESVENDETIMGHYTNGDGQHALAELIENFTKNCLSPGSRAEEKMHQFFSALLLCEDTNKLRENILKLQIQHHGSRNSPYLELLTVKASERLVEKYKDDLSKKNTTTNQDCDVIYSNLKSSVSRSKFSKDEKEHFLQDIEKSIRKKDSQLKKADEILKSGKKYPLTTCQHVMQEITAARSAAELKQKEIENKISSYTNLAQLRDTLTQVEKVLDKYLAKNKGVSGAVHSVFNRKTQINKKRLIANYRKKFHELNIATNERDANFTTLSNQAIALGELLKNEYKTKVLSNKNSNEDVPPKKEGGLGKIISRTTELLDKKSVSSDVVEDDLQQSVSAIGYLIEKIRSMLSKGSSLFKFKKKTDSTVGPEKDGPKAPHKL